MNEVAHVLQMRGDDLPTEEEMAALNGKASSKRTLFMMFLDQFKDFMIFVLIAAGIQPIIAVSDTFRPVRKVLIDGEIVWA